MARINERCSPSRMSMSWLSPFSGFSDTRTLRPATLVHAGTGRKVLYSFDLRETTSSLLPIVGCDEGRVPFDIAWIQELVARLLDAVVATALVPA